MNQVNLSLFRGPDDNRRDPQGSRERARRTVAARLALPRGPLDHPAAERNEVADAAQFGV